MAGRGLAALCMLAQLATAGCAEQRLRLQASKTVRAYNEALVLAYRTGDASPLKDVAVEKEIQKVVVLIDLKTAAQLVLESSLESFAVSEVRSTGPDGMVVRTKERWRYFDRPRQPGLPAGPFFVAEMEMEYEVGREGNIWKVIKGRTLRSETLAPRELRPAHPWR